MSIDIRGFIKSSFNEWENRVCAVVFTAGCNWRCPYCHGAGIVLKPQDFPRVDEEQIFASLQKDHGWVDGVAVTGGEPTLQKGLIDFIRELKDMGVAVKLESNGTNPDVIEHLLAENLLDCLCFDYKVPLKQNSLVHLTQVSKEVAGLERVLRSYELSRKAVGIEKEFHTTLCPAFIDFATIEQMGEELDCPGSLWVLQQYENDVEMINPELAGRERFSQDELDRIEKIASSRHDRVLLRRGK